MNYSQEELYKLFKSSRYPQRLSPDEEYIMRVAYHTEVTKWLEVFEAYQDLRMIEIINQDIISPVCISDAAPIVRKQKYKNVMVRPAYLLPHYPCKREAQNIYKLAGANVWKVAVYNVGEVIIRFFGSISEAGTYLEELY